MEAFIICAIVIGMVSGCIVIGREIAKAMLIKNHDVQMISVVPVFGNTDNIEYIVRSIIFQNNWSKVFCKDIILVLYEQNDEIETLCKTLCNEYDYVNMCLPEDLPYYVKSLIA